MRRSLCELYFFFFNDTATTEIYTLSLHDALPISSALVCTRSVSSASPAPLSSSDNSDSRSASARNAAARERGDRKSTRLNSSHANISYAVFCLKKKNKLISLQCLLQRTFYDMTHQ